MKRSGKMLVASMALALAGSPGCQKQCFLTESDYSNAHAVPIPPNLECDPRYSTRPRAGTTPPPTTVDDTQRQVRYMSLREAIAIALENGTVGSQIPTAPGTAVDTLATFANPVVTGADAIRVLAIDPATVANNIEESLSKFDTLWLTSLTWNWTETPLGITPTTFLPTSTTSTTTTSTSTTVMNTSANNLTFSTGLEKPLPTGGVAGVYFGINATYNTPPSTIDPAIQPSLMFQFEQPLLKGFGVDINQLTDNLPGSVLMPFPVGTTGEGILITRIRRDEQRAEFERNLNYMLLNVEAAYWNLYGAYYQLYTQEVAMRYAFESWRLTKILFDTGRAAEQDVEQVHVTYEQFRAARLAALGAVLDSERQLRGLLNLKLEDGYRIVPTDVPTLVPYHPDWRLALDEALARRPELILARQDLKWRQLDLIRQKNNLLPDLRFVGTDTLHSVGSRIDGGPVPANALHELVSDPFNNFSIGLQMTVPIGFRAANVTVRNAQLNLKRSYLSMITEEDKAERFLGLAYRQIFQFYEAIDINQANLRAATIQLERKFDLIRVRRAPAFGADLILAEQSWSTAASALYTAIVQYNTALATLEFAKGSIREHDSVFISDGPVPKCAQVRAVEHERQQTAALVLKERAVGANLGSRPGGPGLPAPDASHLPLDMAVPLPTLFDGRVPGPEMSPDQASGSMTGPSPLPPPGPDGRQGSR